MRFLVDTNIFLDYLLRREEKWKDSLNFFIWCRENKNQTFITSMSLRDIEYVVHKLCHDKAKTNKILNGVYSLCSKVIGVSANSAINAIFKDYKDYEDELQIQAAKEAMADAIITNNIKDFENRGIVILSPKQVMQK